MAPRQLYLWRAFRPQNPSRGFGHRHEAVTERKPHARPGAGAGGSDSLLVQLLTFMRTSSCLIQGERFRAESAFSFLLGVTAPPEMDVGEHHMSGTGRDFKVDDIPVHKRDTVLPCDQSSPAFSTAPVQERVSIPFRCSFEPDKCVRKTALLGLDGNKGGYPLKTNKQKHPSF